MNEDLPDWWTRYVALERLDCRKFFTEDNWIEYDLDFNQEEKALIDETDVLISGPHHVFDGVDPTSLTTRMARGMGGGYFEPVQEDTLSEGFLSPDSFFVEMNSIETVDPVTKLSKMIYTRHGDELYQWEVAELRSGHFAGQEGEFPHEESRSFYISDEFAELYYRAQKKQAEIKHVRNQVSQGEFSKEEGRDQMPGLYKELQNLYQGFYSDICEYSLQRKTDYDSSRNPKTPPTLTGIDKTAELDEEGNISGKTSIEALTYRRAVRAALKARKAHEDLQDDRQVSYIEKELEHSATAIILAVQSAESYINGVIQEELMDYWENMERMNIRSKWQTVPHLITDEQVFGPDSDAFGKFKRAVHCRNQIVHYKKEEEEFVQKADYGYVSPVVEVVNSREAYRGLSGVAEIIMDLADARDENSPDWVGSDMWVYGQRHGRHDDPLDFDHWIGYVDEVSL